MPHSTLTRNRALIYARLSGVEEDEISPQVQIKRAFTLISELGLEHDPAADIYQDTDKGMHSARKRDNIPNWYRLLERVKTDHTIAAVAIYDMQRAFRSVTAMLSEAELLAQYQVALLRVRGGAVDLVSADGRRRAIDDANNAEYESRKTSERLKDHYTEMRDLGVHYSHTAPLGLQRTGKRHKVKWETNADFKTIVLLCEIYVARDIGSPTLAAELTRRGCTWIDRHGRRGNVKPTTVRKTINTIEKYQPFLPPELYAQVLQTRAARSQRKWNGPKPKHPPLLLRQVLRCARCGGNYTTGREIFVSPVTGKEKQYSFYVHAANRPNCDVTPRTVRAKVFHDQVWKRLARLERLSAEDKAEILERMVAPAPVGVLDTQQQRDKLQLLLRNLESAYLAEDFGPLDEARPKYRKQRADLEKQLAALPAPTRLAPARFGELGSTRARDEAQVWLDNLLETLILGEMIAPAEANRLMRSLFVQITVDGKEVKDLNYHPELAAWLPSL